ncbi:eCIS core domain-containing protein [Methanosarcina sp.]|uniref:eCIS core domain-containing protein n=1 Tax=Methanosarcina sp. TaxID=2213 RepID=UPI003C771056
MPEHQQTQQSTESKTTSQRQATPRIQAPSSHPMAIIQRARINPKSLTHADVMQLQRTIGNRAVVRLFSEIGLIPSNAKQAPPAQRQEIPEEEEPLQGKMIETIQRQEIPEEEEEPLQGKFESIQRQEIPEEEKQLQKKSENNTGMPDNLKAGVENLSGIDMGDVRVHYNSSKPSEVGALAYTQGANIHVAPGQERHLPHEAWHVVQQAQGRVKPTMQAKGVAINDDVSLEHEADVMGHKALKQCARVEKQKEKKDCLPDNPITGLEHSSDNMNLLHYSSKPTQLKASAYAQDTDLHVPDLRAVALGNVQVSNTSSMGTPIQRFPQLVSEDSPLCIDTEIPGFTLVKHEELGWNVYSTLDGELTLYWDEGKYFSDPICSTLAYINRYVIGTVNAGGQSYSYDPAKLTGHVMNILDVIRLATNLRTDLDMIDDRVMAIIKDEATGHPTRPIEVRMEADGIHFKVIQGNHRIAASQILNKTKIPVNFI